MKTEEGVPKTNIYVVIINFLILLSYTLFLRYKGSRNFDTISDAIFNYYK